MKHFITHGELFFKSVLILLVTIMVSSAQVTNSDAINEAALKAFSGPIPGKKQGIMAKAGFELAKLSEEYKAHMASQPAALFVPSNSLLRVMENSVVVDVTVTDQPDVETELLGFGMQVKGKWGGLISGLLPIASLENVASMEKVRAIRPALCSTNIGLTTSQGDTAMRSYLVRSNLGYDGTGITVGVLSDSYNYLSGASSDILSGDLPGVGNPFGHTTPVNVLADDGTTDEGRGMLQIVHDVAPGASLAFATAFLGQASFANYIIQLHTVAGADVIVDDVFYYAEPMFQDGVIAQAVDSVKASGVPYFSSAGNQGQNSYESVWRSGPVLSGGFTGLTFWGGTSFDFDPGVGVDYLQSFTLPNGGSVYIEFQWDSPSASVCAGCPGTANDLDIYITDSAGTNIVASSAYDNVNSDASEFVYYTNSSGSTKTYSMLIVKYSGDDPGFIKYINFRTTQGSLQFATNSSTIYGHANALGAEAVGASAFFYTPAYGTNPPTLNYYSSSGPTAIRFSKTGASTYDARADKPEIVAPDGANTTFFGSDVIYDDDTYPNFFGTSAAAPHAAAVAALMLNADNTLTPDQVYTNLEASTIDMGAVGFDNYSGYGLIQADAASPLPVELASFTVTAKRNGAELVWSTATEVNNHGFEIERRSINSQTWNTIGFVEGSGNSNAPKAYSYNDAGVKGKVTYRLKQIDNGGKFSYSNEVEVNIGSTPKQFALAQNYPNPFNPTTSINLQIPVTGYVRLNIYDALGREVASLVNEVKEAGEYNVEYNAAQLSSGIYFYTLQSGNYISTKKMVLLK